MLRAGADTASSSPPSTRSWAGPQERPRWSACAPRLRLGPSACAAHTRPHAPRTRALARLHPTAGPAAHGLTRDERGVCAVVIAKIDATAHALPAGMAVQVASVSAVWGRGTPLATLTAAWRGRVAGLPDDQALQGRRVLCCCLRPCWGRGAHTRTRPRRQGQEGRGVRRAAHGGGLQAVHPACAGRRGESSPRIRVLAGLAERVGCGFGRQT